VERPSTPAPTRDPATAGDPTTPDPAQWPLGRLLFAVARRVEHDWNAHLAEWDLNHASFPVLLHLLGGPRTQRELSAASGVREQTMSRVVGRLERSGYVTRSDDSADRRRHQVTITGAGRAAAAQAADLGAAESLSTLGLDVRQRAALREALLAMLAVERPGA
jgi:DNA-binding MarR family transcriptional regulator